MIQIGTQKLVSVKEFSEMAQVGLGQVYAMVRKGDVPVYQSPRSRKVQINLTAFEEQIIRDTKAVR